MSDMTFALSVTRKVCLVAGMVALVVTPWFKNRDDRVDSMLYAIIFYVLVLVNTP